MATTNKTKRSQATGKGEPVIEVISETYHIYRYPDGLTVHHKQNRPDNNADVLWALKMISELAPIFRNSNQNEKIAS